MPPRSSSHVSSTDYAKHHRFSMLQELGFGGPDKTGYQKLPCFVPVDVRKKTGVPEDHPLQIRRSLFDSYRSTRGSSEVPCEQTVEIDLSQHKNSNAFPFLTKHRLYFSSLFKQRAPNKTKRAIATNVAKFKTLGHRSSLRVSV